MEDAYEIREGDCREVMRGMDAESIDAIVCDPPYGLSFMGKGWDHGVPGVEFWTEAMRVAKPGAHLLAFGGTRTYHRLACAIEDAGWEVRDCVMWVYGSGFPKSHNLKGSWNGWGTALKPAWEPIIVARKPLVGTVAENVIAHGTGAINVDGCRIGTTKDVPASESTASGYMKGWAGGYSGGDGQNPNVGRWPANVMHDGSEEVLSLFPVAGGGFGKRGGREGATVGDYGMGGTMEPVGYGDSGSAARFFYCAKASKADRDEGLGHLPETQCSVGDPRPGGDFNERLGKTPGVRRNNHPTVKPTALMRYLCRLVTQPGGIVLDPFCGSGSTGKAARLEGFRFIGIERESDYATIARARIAAVESLHE